MHLFGEPLAVSTALFLVIALALAFGFEMVNGFHDTANAVATVIYTHTLRPTVAVVWSGLWNLIGVLASNGAVAFSIVALLPVELVLNVGSGAGFAMVFSLLISAMIWNLGTWYLGLPASSSHTLIGSIIGVGLANSLMSPGHVFGDGVNWGKAREVFASLLISPVLGFVGAALLLLLMKALVRRPELYRPPEGKTPPPFWIRALLTLTCTGVSFFHGSNDGQKGMGLVVLILVGILPVHYALNPDATPQQVQAIVQKSEQVEPLLQRLGPNPITGQQAVDELSDYLKNSGKASRQTFEAVAGLSADVHDRIAGKQSFQQLTSAERGAFRSDLYLLASSISKLNKQHKIENPSDAAELASYAKALDKETKFIPTWVKVAVACFLGFGTMIGWKRIVVTVGEKIGKEHLNYGQGASAEIVAMATIGLADRFGLPVSTTHVLSSGIAGTMAANRSGLQTETLRNILLAWVLTLPICVFLGASLFAFSIYLLFHVFGVR
ncbi:MAG: inorganic phosphate transporter [Acidobacteriaceae bacterium]|nr:inorganic phosphate transporter [Acidobacteriaceae bacterium]MBV8571097.1 inorganic phosphate transporter [Acidobacteriaceae bacterium]